MKILLLVLFKNKFVKVLELITRKAAKMNKS